DQQRLAQLSVFAGGWSLRAARQVLDEEDEIELLDALARMHALSLIFADTAATGEPRQHLLETVREYASALLERSPHAEAARRRHVLACMAIAQEISCALEAGAAPAQSRMAAEMANFRAAHAWCGRAEEDAALGLRLVNALAGCWLLAGMPSQGLELTVEALARPGAASLTPQRAEALLQVGRLGYFSQQPARAQAALQSCLEAADALHLPVLRARALARLSDLAWPDGDFALAHRQAAEAVALLRAHGGPEDAPYLSSALNALGNTARFIGDLEAAERAYEAALDVAQPVDRRAGQVIMRVNLVVARLLRRHEDAGRALLRQVAEVQRHAASPLVDKNLLRGCAAYALFRREWHWALVLRAAEEELARRIGHYVTPDPYVWEREPVARAALGEAAAARACTEGRSLSVEELMTRVRSWLDRLTGD
ncbi:MAG TPA: hypothetical protein VFR86_30420, partial [Burkholderiaceae bacterium]|nr:hypothetical protein [Burkholderiaceae bacterium]